MRTRVTLLLLAASFGQVGHAAPQQIVCTYLPFDTAQYVAVDKELAGKLGAEMRLEFDERAKTVVKIGIHNGKTFKSPLRVVQMNDSLIAAEYMNGNVESSDPPLKRYRRYEIDRMTGAFKVRFEYETEHGKRLQASEAIALIRDAGQEKFRSFEGDAGEGRCKAMTKQF